MIKIIELCVKMHFYFTWQHKLNNTQISSTVTSSIFHSNLREDGEIELFLGLFVSFV